MLTEWVNIGATEVTSLCQNQCLVVVNRNLTRHHYHFFSLQCITQITKWHFIEWPFIVCDL